MQVTSMRHRLLGSVAVLPLVAVACGSSGDTGNTPGQAAASPTMAMSPEMSGGAMMSMQPGADAMKVTIASPSSGTMVTANSLTLQVSTSGFDDTCDVAGKENKQGKGHYHVLLDKSLINMFCTPQATLSLQNVKAGKHTVSVVPAQDDHAEVEANAQSIDIDYEPTGASAQISDTTFPAAPAIKILSPKAGAVLNGPFDVVVQVTNFNLSCDLLGKPDVAGYGHWHLNLDTMTGPMMGMGTMVGMACTTTFHATTQGLQSGQTHSLIALLTDNGHAPLKPAAADKVEVTIGREDGVRWRWASQRPPPSPRAAMGPTAAASSPAPRRRPSREYRARRWSTSPAASTITAALPRRAPPSPSRRATPSSSPPARHRFSRGR